MDVAPTFHVYGVVRQHDARVPTQFLDGCFVELFHGLNQREKQGRIVTVNVVQVIPPSTTRRSLIASAQGLLSPQIEQDLRQLGCVESSGRDVRGPNGSGVELQSGMGGEGKWREKKKKTEVEQGQH